jgi:LysR family transcriptional regulator, cyn operon transcriptional activator
MNLDHLRYFVATSDTLHTGKAAKIMNVSQSTISHGIQKIEDELGQNLFEKVGKRITLTPNGKAFSKRAKEFLEQASRLKNEFRSKELPLEGIIRLGATHGIFSYFFASKIAKMQSIHPNLIFEVYSLRSAQVVENIVARILDVGLCFSPVAHPEVTEAKRWPMKLRIAVRPAHPLLKVKNQKMLVSELSRYPMLSPKAFVGIEVCDDHPALTRLGISSSKALIFDSYDVAASYLKNSNAWCLMPEKLMNPLSLSVVELKALQASAFISLVHPKNAFLPREIIESLECSKW